MRNGKVKRQGGEKKKVRGRKGKKENSLKVDEGKMN